MRKLLLALPVILIIGCSTVTTRTEGVKIDRAQVINITPGVTTRQTVIEMFGNPTEINYENNEEKMVYSFKERNIPSYLGGLVENEARSADTVTTLEIVLRSNLVYSYRFKSSSN